MKTINNINDVKDAMVRHCIKEVYFTLYARRAPRNAIMHMQYVNEIEVFNNEDEDIFISRDMDACFKQYAKAYQEQLDELYNDGAFDEEIQILKSEETPNPQIWQCIKYIVEVDENASFKAFHWDNLYILQVID